MIQVLINLIESSIKFGRTSPERAVTIAAALRDGRVHIAVSDTGPGIPKKALKKVFDDFYRVDNALTRATGGTGIGLALVKKFILAMEGQVHAADNCRSDARLPKPAGDHQTGGGLSNKAGKWDWTGTWRVIAIFG